MSTLCQSCYKVVFKLSPTRLQVVSKLSPSCIKVVSKLSPSCIKVVSKLSQNCFKVVSKFPPSCIKVVVENKILWRPKRFFFRRFLSPLTPVDVNTSITCALQRPKVFPLSCYHYTRVTKNERNMLKSVKTKREIQISKHNIIVALKLFKSLKVQ